MAGGTIGGSLAVGLIGTAAGFLIWRRRKASKAKPKDSSTQHGEVVEIDGQESPRELQEKRAFPAQLDEVQPAIYEKRAMPAQLDDLEPAIYEIGSRDSYDGVPEQELGTRISDDNND